MKKKKKNLNRNAASLQNAAAGTWKMHKNHW